MSVARTSAGWPADRPRGSFGSSDNLVPLMVREWRWDETLFAGAARHYLRGRLPYAPRLAEGLAQTLNLDGGGRLLDVGCSIPEVRLFMWTTGIRTELARRQALPTRHPRTPPFEELRKRYLGGERRAGQSVRTASPDREDLVFKAAGFVGPEMVRVPGWGLAERSADELVANVFSTSSTAPHHFGDQLEPFETDLRALLTAVSPSGRFSVYLRDNVLNIWRPAEWTASV